MKQKIHIYCCENLLPEVSNAASQMSSFRIITHGFPANCGLPMVTREDIDSAVLASGESVLIFGSACLNAIDQLPPQCSLRKLDSCFQLFLPPPVIDFLVKDGAYLLSSGWLQHWRQHLDKMGFDKTILQEFIRESCNYLLHLDSGSNPHSATMLEELAQLVKRPTKSMKLDEAFIQNQLFAHIQDGLSLPSKREKWEQKLAESK